VPTITRKRTEERHKGKNRSFWAINRKSEKTGKGKVPLLQKEEKEDSRKNCGEKKKLLYGVGG